LRIAYLCNCYPAVSHSFIRREIAGVEAAGHQVDRYTVRAPTTLLDDRDRMEMKHTKAILGVGITGLGSALLLAFSRSPVKFICTAYLALKSAGCSPKSWIRHFAYLCEAAWLVRQFRSKPVDHLHAHFGTNPAMVARLTYRLGGPPYSFTVHGPDEFDQPVALNLGGKVADARAVIAISSFCRSQLMRWSNPEDWIKLRVVRCGVDSSFLAISGLAAPSKPRFAAVARLNAQKGLPLLIEAAVLLKSKGLDFNIEIAGDGELRDFLEGMICKANLNDHVQLIGPLNGVQVRQLLISCRAFVLPSFAEGLPVVIMEALALERPVIASAIAGTPELIDSECGWLVPAGSVQALAEAMELAINAPDSTIASMGKEGRRRVADLHDADRNAQSLVDIIDAL
jgi:colanic acid/amylovoran biosynthesis glycosyltransferase